MFNSFVKQNSDSDKTSTSVHDLLLYQTSSVSSVMIHELS
jgi:hypothetical protein